MKVKNSIKIGLLLLFIVATVVKVNAQQESQFTQYMYNTVSINPAYAGSRDVLSITGLYRTQWVGLEGAPQTGTFAVNTPLNDRVGLGISAQNDRIGPTDESNIAADFSYNIEMGETARLFFGLKASANLLNIDYSKLDGYNPNDPNFQYNIDNRFSPNIGAGVYLQSEKWYAGLSIPYMLETNHFNNSTSNSSVQERMNPYLIGGYVFDLSDKVKFKPAVLTKVVAGAPLQLDLSANFLFNDKLTLGAAYRLNAAFSGMAGFQITPGLLVGYAYDRDVTKLGNFNSGSHEVFLRFELFKNNKSIYNPRFF